MYPRESRVCFRRYREVLCLKMKFIKVVFTVSYANAEWGYEFCLQMDAD